MTMTTRWEIELPYNWDFALQSALRKAMQMYWQESLLMARKESLIKPNDVYWGKNLDLCADMILQLKEQREKKNI